MPDPVGGREAEIEAALDAFWRVRDETQDNMKAMAAALDAVRSSGSAAQPLSPFMLRAADRLYSECERAVREGRVDARSPIGDATLDYREIREEGGPPGWVPPGHATQLGCGAPATTTNAGWPVCATCRDENVGIDSSGSTRSVERQSGSAAQNQEDIDGPICDRPTCVAEGDCGCHDGGSLAAARSPQDKDQ